MRLGITGQLAKTLCSTNPCESMIEIVRYTQRNVKRWREGDMRKRWTAAGMLVAEQQFRRIVGYRHLAKLVIAIERHVARVSLQPRLSLTPKCHNPLLSDCQLTRRPPPKFHDNSDILEQADLAGNCARLRRSGTSTSRGHDHRLGAGASQAPTPPTLQFATD